MLRTGHKVIEKVSCQWSYTVVCVCEELVIWIRFGGGAVRFVRGKVWWSCVCGVVEGLLVDTWSVGGRRGDVIRLYAVTEVGDGTWPQRASVAERQC